MLQLTKEQFKEDFRRTLLRKFPVELEEASDYELYQTLGSLVKEYQSGNWAKTQQKYKIYKEKQVYYFSIEFLLGRLLGSNLLNLGIRATVKEALADWKIDLERIEDVEVDPALGNGGLGRLATCFMDSMASIGIPGSGMGIRYKYGLFQQKFFNGYQVELPENWLKDGNVWEYRRSDDALTVKFNGDAWMEPQADGSLVCHHTGYDEVVAIPYDTAMIGYENKTVNTLRLWSAEEAFSTTDALLAGMDYKKSQENRYKIEEICETLYPDDSQNEGKLLRLKQEYFLVSAGVQDIVRKYKELGEPIENIHEYVAIHINDTHPAMCIPEFMRILMDEERLDWIDAWEITQKTMSYTNHTILSEALEKWPDDMLRKLLPRIYLIIETIDAFTRLGIQRKSGSSNGLVERMAIISNGQIRMAHLSILGSHSVNGVAKLHTEILMKQELKDFYNLFPYKFNNKTNGIAHRRWLMLANEELSALLDEVIGTSWRRNPVDLKLFKEYKRNPEIQSRIEEIKYHNKERLADYIKNTSGLVVNPSSIFDVQVKRLHAYKRQLLNALHIIHLYHEILENPEFTMHPRTFIFGGKAAPSYYYAKQIIKLINTLAVTVNGDARVKDLIKVSFLENYNVTLAQKIIPAAEVSEQISTTTKEASGTSNMKFMMNGAITLATLDGANVEIQNEVGDPNIVIFGLNEREVLDYHRKGGYNSREVYNNNPLVRRAVDSLVNGFIPGIEAEGQAIFQSLIDYNDEYFLLKDFESYTEAHKKINNLYTDRFVWNKMAIENISSSGAFSADNTVQQYGVGIWGTRTHER